MKKPLRLIFVILVCCFNLSFVRAQVSLSVINSPYQQNFNSLAATGTTNDVSTLPPGWTFLETGTNANTTYAAGTGSSNTGNTYSLGFDADRALGGLQSGSLIPVLGATFVNNTGSVITSLQISFVGEQWRLGATPRTQGDRLDFQYSLNATSLATGSWTDLDGLDFTSPILSGTVGALNGNLTANRTANSLTIDGLSIAPGSSFWIRWNDFNVSGSDDALAVDDFSLTPVGIPPNQPDFVFTPAALNFGEVNTGSAKILSYLLKGANLTDSLTSIVVHESSLSISLDQVSFTDSISFPLTDTVRVYVKFSPTSNGPIADNIGHVNGALSENLQVTATGYDPLVNIIPIATARTRAAGTKVTVAGRITASDQFGSPSFVQDGTGGIPVFDFSLSQSVQIGDSLIVTGSIALFNDQKQISGSGISFIKPDTTTRIIQPKLIQLSDLAANEGLLVTVQQVELVNKAFVFYPQSTEKITNGSVTADLRIDGDTNIPGLTKPQGAVDITGVVGRFRTNAQLLPRFREDIPGADEPQNSSDSIPRTNTFDLMNWNLEFFGAEREDYVDEFGPENEPLQLSNVQKVISAAKADVIAVQEVSNDSTFAVLVSQLPGYKSICSNRYSRSFEPPTNEFPPQKVCVIYDTTTVKIISTRAMFEGLYDSARNINPSLLPGYPTGDPSSFWSSGRLPFMVSARVTINGVTENIKFINIHAKSGSTVADRNRRVYDAKVLKDSLDAHYANDQIVILGDLNDDLDQSIVSGQASSYLDIVNDTTSYFPATLALSLAGAKSTVSFNDVIDHQILTNELVEEYISGSARVITPFGQIPNYAATTSDHLPVLSRFAFITPKATLSLAAASVVEGTDSIAVNIQLDRPVAEDKQVILSIQNISADASDYFTWPSANGNTIAVTVPAGGNTATLLINTIDDTTDELDENVVLQLQASSGVALGDSTSFSLTIIDNDLSVIAFEESEVDREEGSGAYEVKLSLVTPPVTDQTVTIRVINAHGVFYGSRWDYTTNPAVNQGRITLNIPAGATEVSFFVTPNKDLMRERRPEEISFSIEQVSGGLAKGAQATMTFGIIDVRPCLPVFAVFPNPTFGRVNIFTLPENEDSVVTGTLIDPNGAVIASGSDTVARLSEVFTEALHGRRRGVYTLKLSLCDEVITIRILKL